MNLQYKLLRVNTFKCLNRKVKSSFIIDACWENFPPNLFNSLDATRGPKPAPKQVTVSLISSKRKTPVAAYEERKKNDESMLSQSSHSEPSLVIQDSYQVSEIPPVLHTNTNTSILWLSSKHTSNDDQQKALPRKVSMADCDDEMNCEEIQNEEEKVIRTQLNQKLIKK